jgi:hypothetical protein
MLVDPRLLPRLAPCAALLTLVLSAPAQQTVTLYENSSYGGASVTIPLPPAPGIPFVLPSNWNDRVTSLRWNLAPDTVLTFFEDSNLRGREYCVPHSSSRNGGTSNVGSFYNDKFSSFIWHRVDPAEGWVRFYTNANYGGYQLTRYLSQTGLRIVSIRDLGYNDQVDSIRWSLPPDRTVMCMDEDPAGGRALPLIGSGQHPDLQNQFSGLHHDKFSTFMVMDGQFTATFADRDAPLDRVCQLASHNAHASSAHGWVLWYNQTIPVLEQLDYGARLLQLDVRENNGTLYLTHGTWSASIAQRAGLTPERLGPMIGAIHQWLLANPDEVVFLEFENYTGSTLTDTLRNSVIGGMLYRPTGLHWPSTNELVGLGKRVVVFDSSTSTRELYTYDWMVQNGYSSFGDTAARSESDPIDRMHKSLMFMNHISGTSTPLTWLGNSPNDRSALVALAGQLGQAPNFIGIDGIQMADHGGLEACRWVNDILWRGRPRAMSFEFQDGCSTTLSSATVPAIGSTYRVSAATGSFVMLGFDDRSFGGTPLPMSLSPLSTCQLRVAPLDAVPVSAAGSMSLAIPNSASLLGRQMFLQSVRAAGSSLQLSNGLAATFGF